MLEVENRTSFVSGVFPGTDKDGRDFLTVTVKGTFVLDKQGRTLEEAEEQEPLIMGDVHYGEPGESSVKYESDTGPLKTATDVVLVGHAYPPGGEGSSVDVSLAVGSVERTVRVFGDRKWSRTLGKWGLTKPEKFERMPLIYERAYGGMDAVDEDPAKHAMERRNPVGSGFAVSRGSLEDLPGPNIEDPGNLIKGWKDRPDPVGFGFIGRGWAPRVDLAGTYDGVWEKDRLPLLPKDFDHRYFNGAHTSLTAAPRLKGGESVTVRGATPRGELRFPLPRRALDMSWTIRDNWTHVPMDLDTVVIEPDESRVLLTWRATIECGREMTAIDKIITEEIA